MTNAQNKTVLDRFLRIARELAPHFRARGEAGEALRRLPDESIADILAAGFPRLCQPQRFGGFEEGWDTLCEIVLALAQGDAAHAWVANIYAEHNFLVSLFPDAAQHEVWDRDASALISSSISPAGNKVERTDDGFLLTGSWPFLSGLHHSSWSIVGELVPVPDGSAAHHFFLIPAAERAIVDDWHTMGMVGTGSNSIRLERQFVPAHRALAHADVVAGEAPGTRVNPNPIYRMPMYGFSFLALASIPVGTAEAMTHEFGRFVGERAARQNRFAIVQQLQARLTEASAEAHAARLMILDAARENVAKLRAGERLGPADAARSSRDGAYAALLARRAATRLFEACGAHGIFLPSYMQRAFRDIHAATVHAGMNWDAATVRFGRIASGQPPEPPPF